MTQPVFISYARDASREHAVALHRALGERTAFLDTQDIATGERFPEALVDALFGARVVVIFAEPRYFTRWYCLLEFRIARTPFLRVADRPGATAQEKADALRGLVIAMPPRGVDPMMERFPPLVQGRNWPDVGDIEGIAALVETELAANPPTLRERYAADADVMRSSLLAATRLPPPRRIGNVPFVAPLGLAKSIANEFVGRADDLWRIHDLLWNERGDPATAAALTGAIEATGGFGKTRLALEYLYRFGPAHFRGGLFWINAESDPELQLYDVLQALNPSAPAIEVVRQGSAGVPGAVARAIRSRPDDAPTPLFIIDNVPEPQPDQSPKPLETWCPVLGEVPVLTTSRTRVALGAGGGVVALPIDTLDPASAVDLLTTATQRAPLTNGEWDEIAAWVGYLPLALEVLNRLLRSGEMTPRAVLSLSREQRPSAAVDAVMDSIRYVVPPGALRGITEAFSASYNLLTPEEQYAARLIAWMAPAPVPTFVIEAFGNDVFAPGIRAKLRNRSFVTEVRDGAGAFFGAMHRVLADLIRVPSAAAVDEVETVASLLINLIESAEGRGAAGSVLMRECAPLVLSVFTNWIVSHTVEKGFFRAYRFATRAGIILARWGHPALAGDLFASLASASRLRLGDEHKETLSAINNLAVTLGARADHASAQELQEHVLTTTRRIFGEEHRDTLYSMGNLANTLRDQGDYVGAQELQEHVLEVLQRTFGKEHPDTLSAIVNLANTLCNRGDYAGAQELQERAVELMQSVHGKEHPDTLSSIANLANTLRNRGDYVGAQKLNDRVVVVMERIMGTEHPATLSAMNNLASNRNDTEDHTGAQELQERVVEARRRTLGEEHPETLATMNNLANTRRILGNLAGAQQCQEGVLEVMQRRLGLGHPSTTVAAWGLLQTYIALKDFDAADRVLREDLRWLLDRDTAALPEQQRKIQAALRSMIETKPDGGQGGKVLRYAFRRIRNARRRRR